MKAVILILCLCVSSCATRYLSAEEDAEMKRNCEEHGCTVLPNPVMERLMQFINMAKKWQAI